MSRRLRQLVNERHPPPVHLRKIRHKLLTFLVPLRINPRIFLSLPLQRKTLSLDKNLWRRKFFWKTYNFTKIFSPLFSFFFPFLVYFFCLLFYHFIQKFPSLKSIFFSIYWFHIVWKGEFSVLKLDVNIKGKFSRGVCWR